MFISLPQAASRVACAIALSLFAFAPVHAQQQQPAPPPAPPFGSPITYAQAVKVAQAAMAKAAEIRVPNSIAVVEPSGDLVFFLRMDGAPYSATQLSQQKAWTAARYRRPTKMFYDGVESGHSFFLTFPGISATPGGVPIVVDGKLIGAVGVSGGNGEQDMVVSGAGAEALK